MNDGKQVYFHTHFGSGSIFSVLNLSANKTQQQLKKRNLEIRSAIISYISIHNLEEFLTYIIWW